MALGVCAELIHIIENRPAAAAPRTAVTVALMIPIAASVSMIAQMPGSP